MNEKTIAIIKPDAVSARNVGNIIAFIEKNNFAIRKLKKMHLTEKQAESFYEIHKSKPFFRELVDYMISGPIVVMLLEGENAIQAWRDLMGATDPQQAKPGTIRYLYGTDIGSNAVHGSDGAETALKEIEFFFPYK